MRGLPTWSRRGYSAAWTARRDLPGEVLYVALGDSAAQGLGASRPELGYVGVLADRISAVSAHTVRVVNLSVSGAKIADVVEDQLPGLAELAPDVVTVAVGGNDIRTFDERHFAARAHRMIVALPEHAIVADVPCFWGGRSEQRALVAARIIRDAAEARGLAVAQLHRATEARRNQRARTDFALDMFHPNDAGYAVWAGAFDDAVTARAAALVDGGSTGAGG